MHFAWEYIWYPVANPLGEIKESLAVKHTFATWTWKDMILELNEFLGQIGMMHFTEYVCTDVSINHLYTFVEHDLYE